MARSQHDGLGGEYDAVSFDISWAGLSIVFFLLNLPAPYLVRLQPWRPQEIWMWPLITPMVLGLISLVGLICGLLGLRFSQSRGMARLGTLLNGVVVGLIFLLWVVMRLIIGGR